MVDPTKGIGSLQSLISGTRVTEPATTTKRSIETKESSSPRDEVTLSTEALSLSQAKEAASDVRETLEKNPDVSLSRSGFDESL